MNQNPEPVDRSSASRLYDFINACRIVRDPAYTHFKINWLTDNVERFSIVSDRFRREVYTVKTDSGTFFLKLSPLRRKKDRLRFFLLPWRMTTEWRNLSRLAQKSIPAPKRVLFGYKGMFPRQGFFLVTEAVQGSEIDCKSRDQVLKLADHLAVLHDRGVYHRDLHPENLLLDSNDQPVLLDVQETYFLPRLPRRLKISNLAQFWWHLHCRPQCPVTLEEFLNVYNQSQEKSVDSGKVTAIVDRRQQRHYRSRAARCMKNSTEFQVIRNGRGLKGFKRRDFKWGKQELQNALDRGHLIKDDKLMVYQNVCIKIHNKRLFHKDRSLAGWKMARMLAVRGINVPAALAYFDAGGMTYFLASYYSDSLPLNDHLSSDMSRAEKKAAIRAFAAWLSACHDMNIWQRDFKSSNVLARNNQFMMVDLDGVKIRRHLPWRKKLINLAQLNASISNRLTLKDRLRFFHYYCREELPSRAERRQAYQKIWAITREKNTLPFGLDLEKLAT